MSCEHIVIEDCACSAPRFLFLFDSMMDYISCKFLLLYYSFARSFQILIIIDYVVNIKTTNSNLNMNDDDIIKIKKKTVTTNWLLFFLSKRQGNLHLFKCIFSKTTRFRISVKLFGYTSKSLIYDCSFYFFSCVKKLIWNFGQ